MQDKIFELIVNYWIVIIPYISLLPIVHIIKKRIKTNNKKQLATIIMSIILSWGLNILPAIMYIEFTNMLKFVIIHLSMTFACSAITGFITIIIDSLIKAD